MATPCPPCDTGLSPDSTPQASQAPIASPKKRPRCRICRPDKGSLYGLLRESPNTRLFTGPILWTDVHAERLGMRWEELPSCDSPMPAIGPDSSPSEGHLRPSHTITTLRDCLDEILLPDTTHFTLCSNAVKTVLMTLWPRPFSKPSDPPKLHLYFGGRVYREAVHVQIMWNFPSEETKSSSSSFRSVSTQLADSFDAPTHPSASSQDPAQLPMVCYMGKSGLARIRKKSFCVRPGPGGSWNEPVYRLQQLRARLLVPSNSDHDAYFVGIFLAMAQKHFYPSPPPSSRKESPMSPQGDIPPSPEFQDLTLYILTHDTDTEDFIVYTGYVTKEFLERFHNPFKGPLGEEAIERSGIRIEYARVPIWPILGLRERLGKALGHGVVGEFNDKEMETWEKDPDNREDGKRKRAALSDEADESDEGPSLAPKNRCL